MYVWDLQACMYVCLRQLSMYVCMSQTYIHKMFNMLAGAQNFLAGIEKHEEHLQIFIIKYAKLSLCRDKMAMLML